MPEKPKTALVTGAGGFIGSRLTIRLAEAGYNVRALTRTGRGAGHSAIEWFEGDVRDETLLRKASKDADLIFHLAGVAHRAAPGEVSGAEYESVNVGATRILERVTRDSRSALIFAGTVAVYGSGGEGVVFDERTPLRPEGTYAETKARAEKAVLKADRTTVLRFPAVYGRGMKGNLPRLARAVRRGVVLVPGSGENRKTLVHVEDAVRAMILCAESSECGSRIYNVTDGSFHAVREIAAAMGKALGNAPVLVRTPMFAAMAAAAAADVAAGIIGGNAGYRVAIERFVRDSAVSGALIEEELGFKARYGLEEGWRDAIGGS